MLLRWSVSPVRRVLLCLALLLMLPGAAWAAGKVIYYITPGLDLPFWRTLGLGVKTGAAQRGFQYQVLDSQNSEAKQTEHIQAAIRAQASGIVLSPIDSLSAQRMLALTSKARIPVVIADIGTNGGEYVSYVKSDNYRGAYNVGQAVAAALKARNVSNPEFALCTIELTRKNGQDRTNGFVDAMKEAGFTNQVALRQMKSYTIEETEQFVEDILKAHPGLSALFVEVDKPTLGALKVLSRSGKLKQVVVGSYDGIPEFVDQLKQGNLVAVGMQQPYLMGTQSAAALLDAIQGKPAAKQILVPVLNATSMNVNEWLPVAKRTVFGAEKAAP
ncbi:substrate-binding domain-containing protein [Leeia aquatica]|uniref:Substrate-binding domain-containing protein n=1 Tax=Leeia aquatica TaxID=2725557 RepID=A0A847S3L9_9NEIS|nr:substrate-binding domain-containing protein [Leeia aquatica]NLR74354.1 substrate-binding domain-containing protein [Leeia aquatica]